MSDGSEESMTVLKALAVVLIFAAGLMFITEGAPGWKFAILGGTALVLGELWRRHLRRRQPPDSGKQRD
jgi:hypothetical protein